MNEQEQSRYEAELRRASPARLPEQFMARLRAAKPAAEPGRRTSFQPQPAKTGWRHLLRWLAPALAVAVAVAVAAMLSERAKLNPESRADKRPPTAAHGLKATDVKVDQELMSSYDVVANLPGGEPVRFRCRAWRNQWSVMDTNRGIEIVQDRPRVEVVPVRFETY